MFFEAQRFMPDIQALKTKSVKSASLADRKSSIIKRNLGNVTDVDRLLTLSEVCAICSLSRSTLYRMERDKQFPPGALYGHTNSRRKVWRKSIIDNWLTEQLTRTAA